jgi:hypothetical protein
MHAQPGNAKPPAPKANAAKPHPKTPPADRKREPETAAR